MTDHYEQLPDGAGPCAKQVTHAIVVNGEERWHGSNWCANPQTTCPRGDMPTGQGYELCHSVCDQSAHAEVNACRNAGTHAHGAVLQLEGHYYACENCLRVCREHGIAEVLIAQTAADIEVA